MVSTAPPAIGRPDGEIPKVIGIVCMLLGIALTVWASRISITADFSSDIDPDKVALKTLVGLAGGGFFQLGLVVWIAGYIVHAISFLPGRGE